jgi:hypothetical protein
MRLRPVVRRDDHDDIINSFVRLHPDTVRALCVEEAQKRSHRWPVGSAADANDWTMIAGALPAHDDDVDDDEFTSLVDFLPLELTWKRRRDDENTVVTRLYASYNGGTLSSSDDVFDFCAAAAAADENGTPKQRYPLFWARLFSLPWPMTNQNICVF